MCGINAIFDPDRLMPDLGSQVALMNRAFPYRGPDGEGSFLDGPAALGMRRLAIIDVAGGDQPLYSEDGSIVLVCNGEIYNYVELRAQLDSRGHRFATSSDCETIIHLYEEHGDGLFAHLRGMFAFALWDRRRQRLLVARDRLGLKPLYVARHGRRIAFSSELKALTSTGLASAAVDAEKLYETLRFTFPVDSRRTIARDVERVPPGHYVIVDRGGIQERAFWSDRDCDASPATTADEVEATLDESIRLHLRSDVPVAVLLSGGLDSALVASYASGHASGLVAISAGYRGRPGCDERADAQRSAAQIGVPLVEVELDDADFAGLAPEVARRCDEPAVDIASIAQYALYERCRSLGYKVVLSGIGGDELFFGYHEWNELGAALASDRPELEDRPTSERTLRSCRLRIANRFGKGQTMPDGVASEHQRILQSLGIPGDHGGDLVRQAMQGWAPGPEAVYAFIRRAYLPHNGLQLADKLGMACSVEVRVPLADHLLFEASQRLPLVQRFSLRQSKPLLRRLMRGRIPEVVRLAIKRGFSPPTGFVGAVVDAHLERILDDSTVRALFPVDTLRRVHRAASGDGWVGRRTESIRRRVTGRPPAAGWYWFLFGIVMAALSWQSWTERSGAGAG